MACEICSLAPSPLTAGRRLQRLQGKRRHHGHRHTGLSKRSNLRLETAAARGALQQPEACNKVHYWLAEHDSNQVPALQCSWTFSAQSSCVLTLGQYSPGPCYHCLLSATSLQLCPSSRFESHAAPA